MIKHLTTSLAILFFASTYSLSAERCTYFAAGTNLSSINNFSYTYAPTVGPSDSYPLSYYINSLYDIPFSKNSDCNFYLTFGIDFSVRTFKHQIGYEWVYGYPGGMFHFNYNRTTYMKTTFYYFTVPVMFKRTFNKNQYYFSAGLFPSLVSANSNGQYIDEYFNPLLASLKKNIIAINGRDSIAKPFSFDLKFSLGYFFNQHLGSEFSIQFGLSDVYKNEVGANGGYVGDVGGGRFTVYSLGIIYRLFHPKSSNIK